MLTVQIYGREIAVARLSELVAWGAQKAPREGEWLPLHLGETGCVSDRVVPSRALAVRRANREANQMGSWLPFVLTREGPDYKLYPSGELDGQGSFRAAARSCRYGVLTLSAALFGELLTFCPHPRSRVSALAA